MKPPSRKAYEKTEVERLKDRIAKLEKEKPEALGIRMTIDSLREQVKALKADSKYLQEQLIKAGKYEAYFRTLSREEVFVAAEDGMKYLKGDDLEAYCKALIKGVVEEDQLRHAGYETISLNYGFRSFANEILNQTLRDEIDKLPVHQYQLDAYKYITKGRYK